MKYFLTKPFNRLFALSLGEDIFYVVADLVGTPHFVLRGSKGAFTYDV